MNQTLRWSIGTAALLLPLVPGGAEAQQADAENMTFFLTSAGPGNGADLGGLEGGDAHCQQLAEAAGAGGRTWRAYLSTQADGGPAVNARDRIGAGPWQNALGVVIANDVDELHGTNNLTKESALTEGGDVVNGRGDDPNRHDILTGSQPDGTAFAESEDRTCGNWTSSGDGAAMVGHHDRQGLRDDEASRSWNSSHPSRGGCSQEALRGTGGDGLFYCFATD
ncbi:MAG TPA: hypothetical protein VHK45_06070 [Geminicoccaceae bacterium]|nr:hypothetical protein [Geminicoccaceae bacterium]